MKKKTDNTRRTRKAPSQQNATPIPVQPPTTSNPPDPQQSDLTRIEIEDPTAAQPDWFCPRLWLKPE